MPDLRYHAVTLVGVFIALTVGLLLGIALAEGGTLEEQLQSQVREIRGDLERQRDLIAERNEEIADLREGAEADSELIEGLANATIPNRLEGRTVALVTGPWASGDASRELQNDLAAAGADLSEPVNLEPPQEDDPPAGLEALYTDAALEVLETPMEQQEETPDDEATTAAEEDAFPDGDNGPDVVVFLGGGDPPDGTSEATLEAVAKAERAMFGVWSESEGEGGEDDPSPSEPPHVVAAETMDAERSEVGLFEEVGVASVDDADTPPGRAAVVVLAADDDGATGSYGHKDSASDPFPPPPPSSE